MAKRYHQSHKDRMHEKHGMEHYEKRRHHEMKEAGMISEDYNAVANLPQHPVMKEWPKSPYGMPGDIDDTISGIDRQMSADNNQRRKHMRPHKY